MKNCNPQTPSPARSAEEEKIAAHFKALLTHKKEFAKYLSGLRLRSYQQGVFESVLDSIMHKKGYSLVVMFPRQSGKNELQAHLEVYLLTILARYTVDIIKISPTLKPQAQTCMRRFEQVARRNLLVSSIWKKEGGNSYKVEGARITFLSAATGSNIVGATASGLLEVDEAQQVNIEKYDRDIAPMSASTCATHVFWGTAWTSTTLLARELRAAEEAEKKDGIRRVFRLTAEDVMKELEAYRKHVEEKVARFGRTHPMVRTQYFSEEVDGEGGMFPAERVALMKTNLRVGHGPTPTSSADGIYALLLDVAGEDEGVRGVDGSMSMANPSRDATALTLVEIVMDRAGEERAGHGPAPTMQIYRLVKRWQWIGANHVTLQTTIRDIALAWKVRALVVDATGVGAGLASFLDRALPGRVTPFTFNSTSKSALGWDFLAIVDSGRWQEPVFADLPGDEQVRYQAEFFAQLAACQYEVSNDAKRTMKWRVPDNARHPISGEPLHDDWVLSAALCGVLEKMDFRSAGAAFVVEAPDPLRDMDKHF
jgi:hypothetical protein